MLDWNHNGGYDAFDTAADMMILDEMDKGSSGSSKAYSHRDNSSVKPENKSNEVS